MPVPMTDRFDRPLVFASELRRKAPKFPTSRTCYRLVVDALARSGRTSLVDELERVVSEIERLAGARGRGGEGRG